MFHTGFAFKRRELHRKMLCKNKIHFNLRLGEGAQKASNFLFLYMVEGGVIYSTSSPLLTSSPLKLNLLIPPGMICSLYWENTSSRKNGFSQNLGEQKKQPYDQFISSQICCEKCHAIRVTHSAFKTQFLSSYHSLHSVWSLIVWHRALHPNQKHT